MEYRVLKYFLTVAREENITHAAEILHISQPALSRQLMQLEEELGAQLFTRGQRNITLTDAGILLRRRAQEIIDLTEKTEQEFRNGESDLTGTVAIGSGEAESMRTMANMMRQFSELYPKVKFDLYSNNSDFIKERLDKGLLDVGVLIEPSDLSKYDYIRLQKRERWGVIVPSKCPLSQKDYVTKEDLIGHRIFTSKRGIAQGVAAWFGEVYDQLDIYATYNLLYNSAMLVDCEIGAALAIEGAVSLYHNPNIIFKPFYPELTVSSVVVWKKYQPTSQAVAKFIELIKSHLSGENQEV
ncbi:MAG: LysR family transcriptional regulator [Firmicutes bacterium]|nr:LysR family transcriptional regulator [Bacillota bacterium]